MRGCCREPFDDAFVFHLMLLFQVAVGTTTATTTLWQQLTVMGNTAVCKWLVGTDGQLSAQNGVL